MRLFTLIFFLSLGEGLSRKVPTTTVSMTRSENEINSDNTIATDKTVFDEESDLDSGKNESDEDEEYTVDDTDEEDTTETENVEIENISESTSTLSPLIEGMQKHKRGANSKNIDANRSYQTDFNEDNLKNTEIFRNDKNCIETSNKSDEIRRRVKRVSRAGSSHRKKKILNDGNRNQIEQTNKNHPKQFQ